LKLKKRGRRRIEREKVKSLLSRAVTVQKEKMTRKGKEVVISTSLNHNSAEDEEEEGGFDHSKINGRPFSPFPSFSSRNASSKYDFVKVCVLLPAIFFKT
jgi:hypothetical protein